MKRFLQVMKQFKAGGSYWAIPYAVVHKSIRREYVINQLNYWSY